MATNRELLIARRKKDRGIPLNVGEVASTNRDTSRRTGRVPPKTTGIPGIEQRELAEDPSITEGMKEAGSSLAEKFPALRREPQDITKQLAQGGEVADNVDTGIPTNVTVLKSPRDRLAKGLAPASPSQSFGLPTDRLPSFNELGGAIGQLFKHVGGIAKKRRALGLVPGRRVATTAAGQGLKGKDLAGIIVKQLEAATLAGDKERAATLEAELEKIKNPQRAEEASDLETILGDE